MSKEIWGSCYTCSDYRANKDLVALSNALSDKAEKEERDVIEVADEFMMAALFSPGLFEERES